jgi:hypothetical protein
MKCAKNIRLFTLMILSFCCICSCATTPETVPMNYQQSTQPPCGDILPLMDGCVQQGVQNQRCEESELLVYSRVFAQTNDAALSQKAGTACLISCQSGRLQFEDVETAWREKFAGCP